MVGRQPAFDGRCEILPEHAIGTGVANRIDSRSAHRFVFPKRNARDAVASLDWRAADFFGSCVLMSAQSSCLLPEVVPELHAPSVVFAGRDPDRLITPVRCAGLVDAPEADLEYR